LEAAGFAAAADSRQLKLGASLAVIDPCQQARTKHIRARRNLHRPIPFAPRSMSEAQQLVNTMKKILFAPRPALPTIKPWAPPGTSNNQE
jgi:hypothetical protein